MMYSSSDVFNQLQPRHVGRRERHPGARERHSAQRQRHVYDGDNSQTTASKTTIPQSHIKPKSSYSMNSAISEFGSRRPEVNEEQVRVTSACRELSTIEDIRASMNATAKPRSAPPPHVPDWMVNLDINLDVSSVDIIPPFEEKGDTKVDKENETFTESPSFTFLDTDLVESDSENEELNFKEPNVRLKAERKELSPKFNQTNENVQSSRAQSRQSNRPASSRSEKRPMSNTFRIAGGFQSTYKENESKFYISCHIVKYSRPLIF